MIKRNYYKVVRVFPDPSSYFYIKNETMSDGDLQFFPYSSTILSKLNIEYSFDKVNWTRITQSNKDNINIKADGYVYLRNTTGTFGDSEYNNYFSPHVNISLGGDIRTLFNYTDVDSVTAIPRFGLSHIITYQNNSKLIDISNLSFRGITSVGDYGLSNIFNRYIGTKGVDLRDVTTLGDNALYYMYYGCSNLTEVYAPNVSTWDTSKTYYWLSDVASTGVVYKPSTLDIPTNSLSGIPSGWTTQDYPTE